MKKNKDNCKKVFSTEREIADFGNRMEKENYNGRAKALPIIFRHHSIEITMQYSER